MDYIIIIIYEIRKKSLFCNMAVIKLGMLLSNSNNINTLTIKLNRV